MSRLTVHGPTPVRGRLRVPGDKSVSHRALLLGAMARGTTVVRGLAGGDDVARTAAAVALLGADVAGGPDGHVLVTGGALREPAAVLDVGNSGTGIRLLAGVCAGVPGLSVLAGDRSVAARPMDRVVEPLRAMGAAVDGRGGGRYPPLVVRGGGLRGMVYEVPVPSAQVKAAVLLAGVAADGETVVRERAVTRAHTEELLASFGADVAVDDDGDRRTVRLRPGPLAATTVDVPGDPSQAAFWLVAACAVPGSDLTVDGLYLGRARAGFLDVLARMGADLEVDRDSGTVRARGGPLHGTDVGGDEVPGLVDEVPVLAVAAACAAGSTRFTGLAELRLKETDRLATVAAALRAVGARVEPLPDGFAVAGGGGLVGGEVDAAGDHRVAMAGAVAGLAAAGTTTVDGWDAVATSYPGFEEDLRRCTAHDG